MAADWINHQFMLYEPADYQLLETVYRDVEYEEILPIAEGIRYIDENGLAGINGHVEQKSAK